MSPEVVAERIRMALAEAGRPDLAARVCVIACPVCGTEGAAIRDLGDPFHPDRPVAVKAGRLALADLEVRLIDGESDGCRCAELYA